VIVAISCGTKSCFRLGEAIDITSQTPSGGRKMRLLGESMQINHPGLAEDGLLDITGRIECVGPVPFSIVYGMLRKPGDTVTARSGSKAIEFSKVKIARWMHPDGVLVYASLLPGSNEIVVRKPNGQIASREHGFLARQASSCKKS
jgi:hypothetical protein